MYLFGVASLLKITQSNEQEPTWYLIFAEGHVHRGHINLLLAPPVKATYEPVIFILETLPVLKVCLC